MDRSRSVPTPAPRRSLIGLAAESSESTGPTDLSLIPGRISHGCVRLTNAAILKLGKLLPVGTPVTIE